MTVLVIGLMAIAAWQVWDQCQISAEFGARRLDAEIEACGGGQEGLAAVMQQRWGLPRNGRR